MRVKDSELNCGFFFKAIVIDVFYNICIYIYIDSFLRRRDLALDTKFKEYVVHKIEFYKNLSKAVFSNKIAAYIQ